MARVFFMAFESAGQGTLIKRLRNAGHKLIVAEPRYPDFYALLKQQTNPPELFVADCGKLPSHARESCHYIRSLKTYRNAKFVLYNVKSEDEGKSTEKVPGAVLVSGDDPTAAIEKALKEAVSPNA